MRLVPSSRITLVKSLWVGVVITCLLDKTCGLVVLHVNLPDSTNEASGSCSQVYIDSSVFIGGISISDRS